MANCLPGRQQPARDTTRRVAVRSSQFGVSVRNSVEADAEPGLDPLPGSSPRNSAGETAAADPRRKAPEYRTSSEIPDAMRVRNDDKKKAVYAFVTVRNQWELSLHSRSVKRSRMKHHSDVPLTSVRIRTPDLDIGQSKRGSCP
jgi:hypothetical protein